MKAEELAVKARKAIDDGTNMTLTMEKGTLKCLSGFPRGDLLLEQKDGRRAYSFNPQKIIDWLQVNNLI